MSFHSQPDKVKGGGNENNPLTMTSSSSSRAPAVSDRRNRDGGSTMQQRSIMVDSMTSSGLRNTHGVSSSAAAAAAATVSAVGIIATDEFGFPSPSLPSSARKQLQPPQQQHFKQHPHMTMTVPTPPIRQMEKVVTMPMSRQQHQQQQHRRLPLQRQQSSTQQQPKNKNNYDFIRQYTSSSSNITSSQQPHITLAAMAMRQVAPPKIIASVGSSSISTTTTTSANKSRTTTTVTNATTTVRNKITITTSSSANTKDSKKKYTKYTFQHPSNAMRLSVRTVDLSRRVAFDRQRILRTSSTLSSSSATAVQEELLSSSSSSYNIMSSVALRRMVEEMDRVRNIRRGGGGGGDHSSIAGVGNTTGNNNNNNSGNPCRISPSPNHMALLEFMHGLTTATSLTTVPRVVRQLRWNVACSEDADPWFDGAYYEEDDGGGGDDDVEEVDDDIGDSRRGKRSNLSLDETRTGLTAAAAAARSSVPPMASAMPRRKRPSHGRNDGRYIPIDALASVRSSIPNHSPILTNVKRRLPTRSDVGFANPSPEEVNSKMDEVRKEAEWEEASPRIVLLASGFLLFGDDNESEDMRDDMVDKLHPSCREDVTLWAGGAIPGVPFAGRDLVTLYKRTMLSTKSGKNDNSHATDSADNDIDQRHAKNPRTYSVFAPPVDAMYSSSQLWRPRPFMDRPPGHIYFLACPLDLRLDEGDTEPFFCTMSLYCLPQQRPPSNKMATTDSANNTYSSDNLFRGKISEDFFFPAGDWNAIEGFKGVGLEVDEGRRQFDSHDDEEPTQQSWRRRKRRAIMSYDPLDVSLGDLHLVIQVYRATGPKSDNGRGNAPTADQTNGSSHSKRGLFAGKLLPSKAKSRQKTQAADESGKNSTLGSFEELGAQYLVPVCFGITPVFPAGYISHQKIEKLALISFPDASLSNEDFVKLLTSISNTYSLPAAKSAQTTCGSADLFTSYLGR